MEGESGALNESHMFPKMEAFQAAWALWAGGGGAPPALLAHTRWTVHGRAPSTRFHSAPLRRREARYTFAAERESALNAQKTKTT